MAINSTYPHWAALIGAAGETKTPRAEAQGAIYTKYLKERHRRRGARENNI